MYAFKTIATGLTATMLATTILTAQTNAAPKPQINPGVKAAPNVVKNNIVKSIRPRITPRIKVNTANLATKGAQEPDDTAGKDYGLRSSGNNPAPIAALIPPTRLPQPRPGGALLPGEDQTDSSDQPSADLADATPPLPQPRPEFFDKIVDLKDVLDAEGLGEINPDEFRVGSNQHDPDGLLADLGLRDHEDENDTPGNIGPTGPAGGVPDGFGDNGNGLGTGPEFDGLVGDNSHGKDAPGAAPGVKVTPGSIAAAAGGVASDPPNTTPGEQAEGRDGVPNTPQTRTVDRSGNETTTKTDDGQGGVTISTTRTGNGRVTETSTHYENGEPTVMEVWTARNDGTRTHVYYNYNTGIGYVQQTGMQDTAWRPDQNDSRSQTGRRGPITTTWKTDPDYVEGGGYVPPNCGSFECNKARQRQANPGLALKEAQDGATKVYPGPDGGNTSTRTSGEPIVSQHDLVANYDPDSGQNDGEPARNLPSRIQSD